MKTYTVHYLDGARLDVLEIIDFLVKKESVARAAYILEQLHQLSNSLNALPNRGHIPPELVELGSRKFLELHCQSYRMIYQVVEDRVFIHCVYDGRRNMQDLLYQRLLKIKT